MPDANDTLPRPAILVACCLGMLGMGLALSTPPLFARAIATAFGLDNTASGLFLGCMFWGMVAGIFVSGPVADRVGFRVLLVGAVMLQAAGMCVVARSTGMWDIYLGSGIAGFGMGIVDALATPLACAAYPRARARVANLLHSFFPLGLLLAGVLVMLLRHWGWRRIYLLMGLACLPAGLLFLFLRLPAAAHEGPDRLPTRRLITLRPFLLLLAAILLAGGTEIGFSFWLPTYIEKAQDGTPRMGTVAFLVFGVAMTLGRLGHSAVAHRFRLRALWIAGAAATALLLLLASLNFPPLFTILCAAVLGVAVSGLWPTTLALAGNRFPQAGASMYSTLHVAGNTGALLGPLMVGVIADRWDLHVGVALLAVAPLAALVVIRLGRE
ncbi:MAG: MFS transporter [Candidatus Brocadiia bacterium]|nr:MFS transporter [Candidatus Brocadiia bacterium]